MTAQDIIKDIKAKKLMYRFLQSVKAKSIEKKK